MNVSSAPLTGCPALVLNADFRPLSYYPLSLWPWQEAVKAVFLDRVEVVAEYDQVVHSPSFEMRLPSVISLREYISQDRPPAFTRFNVFLRDGFACQYCGTSDDLTFDHLIPRSKGGRTTWENIVTACAPCNLKKGGRSVRETRHAPAPQTAPPEHARTAKHGPPLPAALPARDLGRLSLLGCRTGSVRHGLSRSRGSIYRTLNRD